MAALMYLKGLADGAYMNSGQEAQCIAAGGLIGSLIYGSPGQPTRFFCTFIPRAAAAPQQAPANITVTVPTTTQISPQISPQFIQQEHPVDSGINAGVSQAVPFTPNVGEGAGAQQVAPQSETEKALIDLLTKQAEREAAQPSTAMAAPAYQSPQPIQPDIVPATQPSIIGFLSENPLLLAAFVGLGILFAMQFRKGNRHVS